LTIALFTPYSPDIGGGAVQLRSVLPELRDLDVKWYYLAQKKSSSYPGEWLGEPVPMRYFLADLLGRAVHFPGSRKTILNLISGIDADVYWIIAHNEGVSVAAELIRQRKIVHLSVHDDPTVVFARSRKYRAFRFLMSPVFRMVLRNASTVDVIGWGMRDVFNREYGIESRVLYRYAPSLPEVRAEASRGELRIGHVGQLYSPGPFKCFLLHCKAYAAEQGRTLKVVTAGTSPYLPTIQAENPGLFELHGQIDEAAIISLLSSCDFVYAMYPNGPRHKRFRQTSVPMKVSTYILAQRPIFAHTPLDSSLAGIVSRYRIGSVCTGIDRASIHASIREVLGPQIGHSDFGAAQLDLLGRAQIHGLRAALGARV
jgi:hypothetical protein